jgi:hypothetical protein
MYIYFIYNFADFPRPRRDSEKLGGAALLMKSDPCNYKYDADIQYLLE